jgi:hypothetical protein
MIVSSDDGEHEIVCLVTGLLFEQSCMDLLTACQHANHMVPPVA